MATNRDLLKEAIADAKAVKEMAIANAKAALEEAFTPQLQSMLSAKLQEMEEEEELDEVGFGKMTADSDEGFSEMGEKALDEADDDDEDDLDLDELLNELNEEEEEEEEMETEEEGEPLDLEDMTDEDLKKFIEDVIADMVSSGELEAGEGEEGEEAEGEEAEGEEEEMETEEEEINLDELLAEIEGMDEEMEDEAFPTEMDEAEEGLDEIFGFGKAGSGGTKFVKNFIADKSTEIEKAKKNPKALTGGKVRTSKGERDETVTDKLVQGFQKYMRDKDEKASLSDISVLRTAIGAGGLGGDDSQKSTMESIQSELDEALATIKTLRGNLNEINLLNAKLLFTNKIFKAKNLTESQKVNVLTTFDKATTVKEVKLVFETLNDGLKVKSSRVNENYGSASKGVGTTKSKQPIVESDPMVARFQKLAGII